MDAVAPSESAVAVLRAISRAGFAYAPTKALCRGTGWELVDDEPDLGFVRFDMLLAPGSDAPRLLSVMVAESRGRPIAFVPLFFFEEYDDTREPFDRAFLALFEQLAGLLGGAPESGVYSYPHRAGWSYSFAGWALPDATFVLVQDEYDIQFGMEVTLWVQPAGTAVGAAVRVE
jgi:hypothetical protein